MIFNYFLLYYILIENLMFCYVFYLYKYEIKWNWDKIWNKIYIVILNRNNIIGNELN